MVEINKIAVLFFFFFDCLQIIDLNNLFYTVIIWNHLNTGSIKQEKEGIHQRYGRLCKNKIY